MRNIKKTIDFWQEKIGSKIKKTEDFLAGQRDCKEGEVHKIGMSEDYDRGYGAQYQHEQNMARL